MALYRDDGVVLRTYKLGEADRIVVLYSRGRGKIRAVAKGVRRTRSKFGSRLEPGSIVQLQLYEGRNLDIVTQAERIISLPELRSDLDRYGRAAILLEAVDHVANEGDSNPALFKLLMGALRELNETGSSVIVPAFVGKLLALEGVQPMVDACVSCGATDDLVVIQLHEGGVLCQGCRRGGQPISEAARQAFCLILEGKVRHVLNTTSPETAQELEALAARMIEQHIERRLQSSTVINEQLNT